MFQSPIVWVTKGKKGQIMFQSRLVYVTKGHKAAKQQIMFQSPHVKTLLATWQFSTLACELDRWAQHLANVDWVNTY